MRRGKDFSLKDKSEKDSTLKLLAIPGIKEAIDLVKGKAWELALDEVLKTGEEGKLGDELQHLLIDDSSLDNIDKFFRDNKVDSAIGDITDEKLEDLAFKAGPKISELWRLSEPAGEKLIDIIYIEALENYITLITNKKKFTIHFTMKAIEEQFPADIFIRVHRSFIVNKNMISAIQENSLDLIVGDTLKSFPVSKSYRDLLLKNINMITR